MTTVRRSPEGTPETPDTKLRPGSRYAGMDAGLLEMLGRTLKAGTYWKWKDKKPKNLDEALDLLGPAELHPLVKLKQKLDEHGLWGHIETMKTVWTTSSLGIDYEGTPMEGVLDGKDKFCKDTDIGQALHKGAECWREVADPPGAPGLHYCTPNSIHIDPHQVTEGRSSRLQLRPGSLPKWRENFCNYAMMVWLDHMQDVVGGRHVNVFHQHQELGDWIRKQKARIPWLSKLDAEALEQKPVLDGLEARRAALTDTLKGWAIRGFEGDASSDSRKVIDELNTIQDKWGRARDTLDGIEYSKIPRPSTIYGY